MPGFLLTTNQGAPRPAGICNSPGACPADRAWNASKECGQTLSTLSSPRRSGSALTQTPPQTTCPFPARDQHPGILKLLILGQQCPHASHFMLEHGVLSWPVHDYHRSPNARHHSGSDQAGCSSHSQSLPYKCPSRNVGCHPCILPTTPPRESKKARLSALLCSAQTTTVRTFSQEL